MAERGRGNIPKKEQLRALQLYCERGFEDQFVYSPDQIAKILDLCPKSVRKVIRDESVRLISRYIFRNHP